jgi:hypothetical protein
MKNRELVNFKIGPGGNPRIPARIKVIQSTGEENRKQWEKGIDKMIAYRKKHSLQ